jgi:hypothetical protein
MVERWDSRARLANNGRALFFWVFSVLWLMQAPLARSEELREDGYHVFPGDEIQKSLDRAATNATLKRVVVHAGTYRPNTKRQALLWLNRRHEGIQLVAEGEVTLTAENSEIAGAGATNKAVVNHVIYIGHQVTSNTVVRGFRVTGANAFCLKGATRRYEPDETIPKNLFFFSDGGAVKIFGHSSPTLENLVIESNYTTPCAGGISIQQERPNWAPVIIRNCIFRDNRAQVTGSALDLLAGSSARVENCLFVRNASNMGVDIVALGAKETPFTNSGVVTVFEHSRLEMSHCTFVENRNAIDDRGGISVFKNSIFYKNDWATGLDAPRYEIEFVVGTRLENCRVQGAVRKVGADRSVAIEHLSADDPAFDADWTPKASSHEGIGYRPIKARRP